MKLLLLCLLVPAVVQGGRHGYYHPGYGGWYGPWNAKEVDTGEFEEDPAKNSILLYDLDNVEDIKELEAKIQKICQCKIEHLPAIQSFILHYENSAHLPASTFSSLPGIIFSNEDEVIMPPDEEDRDRRGRAEMVACIKDCWMDIEKRRAIGTCYKDCIKAYRETERDIDICKYGACNTVGDLQRLLENLYRRLLSRDPQFPRPRHPPQNPAPPYRPAPPQTSI